MLLLALLCACRCQGGGEEARTPRLPHFASWPGLVRAAQQGRVDDAVQIARDLTEGEAGAWDGPGGAESLAAVGGAVGFLQQASDVEDLADGVAAAAAGCAACHLQAGVEPRDPRPPWTHPSAAQWAAWGIVFGDDSPAAGGPEPLGAIAAAWTSGLDAVLRACQQCHGGEPP